MKLLSLCFAACVAAAFVTPPGAAAADPAPALRGPLVDEAGVVEPEMARAVEALARELQAKTGAEVAALTVRSTAPLTAFDYGMRVLEEWRLGRAGRDDGLLLLVVVDERQVRFFQGYGLEGILPDGRLGAILDQEVLPAFRAGSYGRGIHDGLRAAAAVIAEDAGVVLDGRFTPRPPAPQGIDTATLLLLLFVVIVLLSIVAQTGMSTRRVHGRRRPPVFWDGYRGRRGPGGFGRGGFGGGFGGGGRFGGGGAGRGW